MKYPKHSGEFVLAWATDTHFDLTTRKKINVFCENVLDENCDALLLTGDISDGESTLEYLEYISKKMPSTKIYFVLGNHDYYDSSISEMNKKTADLCHSNHNLKWLSTVDYVPLTKNVCLVGNENWWDGDFETKIGLLDSFLMSKDYKTIREIIPENPETWFKNVRIQSEICESAILQKLNNCFKDGFSSAILAIHVPPYRQASHHFGMQMGSTWLNHFCNRNLGDKLNDFMDIRRSKKLKILCGHTHSSTSYKPIDNIVVKVGKSNYFEPKISKILKML